MRMYIIYSNPSDYPGKFVVREAGIPTGLSILVGNMIFKLQPTGVIDSLEEARKLVPQGYNCIPRSISDDPVIVETWI